MSGSVLLHGRTVPSCFVQSNMPRPTHCCLAALTAPVYVAPAQRSEWFGSWHIDEDPDDVDREERRNTTLLHEAAWHSCLAALRLLLAVAPASAWAAHSRRSLPISLALSRRRTDVVQLLLATMPAAGLGADEVAELLLQAARSGQWNAMHMLLDAAPTDSLSGLATDVRASLLLDAAGSDSLPLLQTTLDALMRQRSTAFTAVRHRCSERRRPAKAQRSTSCLTPCRALRQ